tara:strand:+ start:246 stop:557 length:312 start_codon:yes stop_codon:yes gene_type:complete
MKWLLLGGGIVLATIHFRNRSEPVAVLPENPDNSLAKEIRQESFLEHQKANEAYWNRWRAKNIVTMSDKMWDYQMERYQMYEDGHLDTYRWNNPIMPPSIFYG